MNGSASDSRGTITRAGGVLRVDHALVEEVSLAGGSQWEGYVVISYAVPGANQMVSIELFRLNVGRNTVIMNSFGRPVRLRDIRPGMWLDAMFSPAVTRSIPPQSMAFLMVVQRDRQPAMNVTTDRVAMVDARNGFLYTGNPRDISRQMRFVITDQTLILNRNGMPIRLNAIRPGQMVQVSHAVFQTASIPPQTTAFMVQLL